MKRLIFLFLAAGMLRMPCFGSAPSRDILPRPAFPLEDEVIIAALEKSGLPGRLSETETVSSGKGQRTHTVRSLTVTYSDMVSEEEADADPGTRLLTACIRSVLTEGERALITIFDQIDISGQMEWEDWKQQLTFAALLYGGFESEEQVYRSFAGRELPAGENFCRWDAHLPAGYCIVTWHFFDESSNPKQKSHALMSVNIYESQPLYHRLQKTAVQFVP